MTSSSMTYKDAGVDYDPMDFFKREATSTARETAHHLENFGYREVKWSRGESCYLYETEDAYRGKVNEGLGTKNLVADAMYKLTGQSYYYGVAIDTIAMIVNDMITPGCMPITVDMHVAAGSSEWFKDKKRCADLIAGWKHGCDLARCTWAGGETPTLRGMVEAETVILSGSADGEIKPKNRVIKPAICEFDLIVFLASSGIHANGLTLARKIAEKLPNGYLTPLSNGQTYGEALLTPTTIYVPFIKACLDHGAPLHYVTNITGHGWRKLMRHHEPFVYIIDAIGEPHPLFPFMQKHGPINDQQAYNDLNMGVGLAVFVPQNKAQLVLRLATAYKINAWIGGHVEKRGNEKKVIINPKGITFEAESLAVR